MSGDLAILTAAAFPFRSRARVLVRSLRRFHPEVEVFALSVANSDPGPEAFAGATAVRLENLGIPDLPGFLFRYTCRVVAIATKPFLLAHALDRGYSSALFLDADLWVLDGLGGLLQQVRSQPLTLSSHRSTPAATATEELRLLRAGTFNGGVVGVSAGRSRRFLDWWGSRVHADCRMAPEAGLHDDQRWLDLAPGFVAGCGIVDDAGVNVAYWNLDERPVVRRGGRWFAGTAPLRLFHFSGFDLRNVTQMSRHSPLPLTAATAELFAEYAQAVVGEEAAVAADSAQDEGGIEYLSSHFANGAPIPEVARSLYAKGASGAAFGDPTRCGPGSYFDWLLKPVVECAGRSSGEASRGSLPLPRLWLEIHGARPDLQRAFPEPCGRDRKRFAEWVHHYGRSEYSLDSGFLPDIA